MISSEADLREVLGSPSEAVLVKISDRLNGLTRQWIERSPFLCIATASSGGNLDVSPRGDPPGFVRILDERTLLIPDRPGNKIADTLRNVIDTGRVALLFVVPGVDDTFRVNGSATLTDDAGLLAPSSVEGKVPKLGILVSIEECYGQCAKAFKRSDLWNPDHHIDREELPSAGAVMKSLKGDFDAETYDAERAGRYERREGFY